MRQYMPLLVDLTKRDFKVRYLGSLLGSYWNVIHPLMMIFIYTVVFSSVMQARLGEGAGPYAYSLYLCTGLLAWNFFAEIANRGAVALLENAPFLKKIAFPPAILFGALYASASINFLISFAIFFTILMLVAPVAVGKVLVFLLCVALFGLLGFALAVCLGCLNVFLRDFQQLTNIVFQLWFWFTPIVYLFDHLPEAAQQLLMLNPAWP